METWLVIEEMYGLADQLVYLVLGLYGLDRESEYHGLVVLSRISDSRTDAGLRITHYGVRILACRSECIRSLAYILLAVEFRPELVSAVKSEVVHYRRSLAVCRCAVGHPLDLQHICTELRTFFLVYLIGINHIGSHVGSGYDEVPAGSAEILDGFLHGRSVNVILDQFGERAVVALALLASALIWFNLPESGNQSGQQTAAETVTVIPAAEDETAAEETAAEEPASEETTAVGAAAPETEADGETESFVSSAPIGHEKGQQLPDFTITCYDGSTFHLADTRGKVTIINLWATYCAPCVKELPYFSDFYKEHEGDVAVLAVHSSLVAKDNPEEYTAGKGYAMPFATDTKEKTVFEAVGGGATLPQTIVLNRKGEVIYNEVKSVTPEMLESLYQEASASE